MKDAKELLNLLSHAFEMEYNDVFLYLREAERVKRKLRDGEKLAKMFEEFSMTELRHADRLSSEIISLGGKPVWKFAELETESSIHKILDKHIENEMHAYNHYKKIMGYSMSKDFELAVSGIMQNEKYHMEKLIEFYNKLELRR
ncbi:MAG TPA: hypothetical protein DEE98_09125 [Elusimicrobia bacterium]|nr:MAG: hypothetical protein A2278_06360 [Elusimicrobia bacterium RIFOXYA12_FULL_49_49]OGS06782.1 MAG: hypothetical protein A2204_01680 [Elusimicrobia bacterium RIFOXYA1_FULL_47_7]OGS16299.1 MAG: hypothetical protein A2251_01675 [Elusimicrobia bacterium RIFOXYA2_FULL_47_53]OGS25843.1 MAG: hypothetical protein A2339_03565 [Elusimicrobia bacterium RIFOXYB12_FULL_50_12]OGS31454.1 MAG: hypothetical protein A2323_09965 [Elusimicrobia bacterium RIFOXYB2_FULL_46_23]HBU70525.1 hypothetical protein [El